MRANVGPRYRLARRSLAAALLAALAWPASAAPVAPDRNAGGKVTVRVPLTLTRLSDLDFGTLLPSGQGGAAFINAYDGARIVTGGVTAMPSDTGYRARFRCSGSPLQDVSIRLGPPPTLLNGTGGSMRMLSLTLDGGTTRRIPASGTFAFGVGGAVMINADQPEGAYSAAIDVTVDYL